MALKRVDVIERLCELNDVETKAAATRILDYLLETITEEIKSGGEVYLGAHFGGFKAVTQPARTGVTHNVEWSTPEKTVIKFKPSSKLKNIIKG